MQIEMSNVIEEIKQKCKDAGTNLTEICRELKINRTTVEKWKRNEPKAVTDYKRILVAIESRKEQDIIL